MKYWCSYVDFRDTYVYEFYNSIVPSIENYFENKSYSVEVEKLKNILNCSPDLDVAKLRNRFSRKEKYLYFDVMINYQHYIKLTNAARKNYIAECFLRDMEVLRKYKPKGFILENLKQDFKTFFQSINWLLPDD